MDALTQLIHDHLPNYIFFIFLAMAIIAVGLKFIKEVFYPENKNLTYFDWLLTIIGLKKVKNIGDIILYKDEEREEIKERLRSNNFFNNCRKLKQGHIPVMQFGSQRKNDLLKNVIKIYIDVIEKEINNIMDNENLDEYSTIELNRLFSERIEKVDNEIYSKIKASLGDKLYDLLIESPKGFKVKNKNCREILIDQALSISEQDVESYNGDNYVKAEAILTSMDSVLKVIVNNFERTFDNFNGELDEILKNR